MKRQAHHHWFTQIVIVLAALAMAACSPTQERRGTGEYVDDAAVTARVKTALIRDGGMRGATDIEVETFRGVVQLSGFVESQEVISRAVSAARNVEGVRSVQNALQVRPGPATSTTPRS